MGKKNFFKHDFKLNNRITEYPKLNSYEIYIPFKPNIYSINYCVNSMIELLNKQCKNSEILFLYNKTNQKNNIYKDGSRLYGKLENCSKIIIDKNFNLESLIEINAHESIVLTTVFLKSFSRGNCNNLISKDLSFKENRIEFIKALTYDISNHFKHVEIFPLLYLDTRKEFKKDVFHLNSEINKTILRSYSNYVKPPYRYLIPLFRDVNKFIAVLEFLSNDKDYNIVYVNNVILSKALYRILHNKIRFVFSKSINKIYDGHKMMKWINSRKDYLKEI